MKKKLLTLIVMILSFGLLASGCNKQQKDPEEQVTHTVKFFVDDEQYGETIVVNHGDSVAKPATDPVKEENEGYTYTFKEWQTVEGEAYDFSKPVVKNLRLDAAFTRQAKEHDLVIYVWTGDGSNTYLTEAEVNFIKEKVQTTGKDVYVESFGGVKATTFYASVNNKIADGKYGVDMVIGGATISPKDTSSVEAWVESIAGTNAVIEGTETPVAGRLANIADGWFASSSRYVGICGGDQNPHYQTAKLVYDALLSTGPNIATLSDSSVAVEVGKTYSISVSGLAPGATYTFKVLDTNVATISDAGVITGVKEGTTKVIVTVNEVVEYSIDLAVEAAAEPFELNVFVAPYVYEYIDLIQSAYEAVKADYSTINFVKISKNTVADFSAEADGLIKADGAKKPGAVIAHTQVSSGHANGLAYEGTYAYVFTSRVNIDETWVSKEDTTNYYVGTFAGLSGFESLEISKIGTILQEANAGRFSCTAQAALLIGDTKQIEVSGYKGATVSGATFISENEAVATVSATGLITAVAAGTTNINVTVGGHKEVCSVTVTAKPADLVVYIAGHTNVKITETEANAIIDAFKTLAAASGKDIAVDYSNLGDADFGARVKAAGNVDVVIGSNNLDNEAQCNLALDATMSKTGLGEGWVASTGRYVGVLDSSTHKELAKALFDMLVGSKQQFLYGDDYFELDKEAAQLQVGETVQLTATVDGVTFVSDTEAVATVSAAGLVTAVSAGTAKITASKGSYSVEVAITVNAKPVDLVVYVAGHTSIKITEAEAQAIIAQFKELYGSELEIVYDYSNLGDADFGARVKAAGNVDVVLGSKNLDVADQCNITMDATMPKTSIGEGWLTNARYVGVLDSSTHKELAKKFFDMLVMSKEAAVYGDDYFTLDKTSLSIKVGETAQLTASKTGVIFASDTTTVATVDASGLVTAVAEGTAKITVSKGDYSVEVTVTVIAAVAQPYTLTVYMAVNSYANIDALKAAYEALQGKDSNCTLVVVGVGSGKVAEVSKAIDDYNKLEELDVNLVVAHTQVTSGHENGLAYADTYNYTFEQRTLVDGSWANAATNYYAAVDSRSSAAQKAEAEKIIAILAAAIPA